jgi:hypothetical protein
MDKVTFETNIPRQLRLQYLEGLLVDSNFGGKQYKFSSDQGSFWVSEMVGNILHDQIRKYQIQVGEAVEICKREVDQGRGRKGINWVLTRCASVGPQPNGTFAVPKLAPGNGPAEAGAGTPAPVTAATETPQPPPNMSHGNKPNGNGAGGGSANGNGRSMVPEGRPRTQLEEALKTVVAAVHAAQEYAEQIGYSLPAFTSEDLRAMANTLVTEGKDHA